ncbi:MAG: class I SAM-dependent methyltransferase [Ruminococcus sp.]|nr:class I SAM-dependent methyltransferase [Ruminococcus sp.]
MENPWKTVSLDDYESHMALGSVRQLQTLNEIMKRQLNAFPARSVMILGVAGGNGLEHIDTEKYSAVYGVDVNPDYLREVEKRYPALDGVLKCLCADCTNIRATADVTGLPEAELVIANLLIEYIGYDCFKRVLRQVKPRYVSCVIQVDSGEGFVSDSPYLHSFDCLDSVHRSIGADRLANELETVGYMQSALREHPLPNGKRLTEIDFFMKL